MSYLIDTNVLVRFLVADDQRQAEQAKRLLDSLSADRPVYICREVAAELAWVLERSYGFDRTRVAKAFAARAESAGIRLEEQEDVAAAASGAEVPITFDHRVAALDKATLVDEEKRPEGSA